MFRWMSALAGALLLALGLSACTASALPPLPAGSVRAQRISQELTFTLDSAAAPKINTTQHLRVTLSDADGRPVEATSVYFDLEMDMICLSGSKPIANPTRPGGYEIDVVYVMAGNWRVKAVAELGERSVEATFPITVTE